MNETKNLADPLAGGPAEPGIYEVKRLPDLGYKRLWESIIVSDSLKESLLCQAALNFTIRSKVDRSILPMHGIILLVGPPGTGKTTLAKGLASETASLLKGSVTFLEVEPHSLTSSSLGKSQKAVTQLFGTTIAEYAMQGPTIVLLDEVETILADRAKLSLEANPIDVHRATDAALVALDHLAAKYPNLLVLATSNFPDAIDRAFYSRCDLIVSIPLPDEKACFNILKETIEGLAKTYPALRGFADKPAFASVARKSVGLDGRQLRKLVASACTYRRETALDPGQLSTGDLERAAERAVKEQSK